MCINCNINAINIADFYEQTNKQTTKKQNSILGSLTQKFYWKGGIENHNMTIFWAGAKH